MTSPATATATKPATAPKSNTAAPAPAGFSFKNLSVQDAELPTSRVTPANNAVLPILRESASKRTESGNGKWEGQGKSVTIPASACVDMERLVRQAADVLDCGSMIRMRTPQGGVVEIESVGATEKKSETTGKVRKVGGTPTVMVDGKPYTGDVVVFFRAKSLRNTKK